MTEIDTGGGTTSYGIDLGEVAALMRARFPGCCRRTPAERCCACSSRTASGTPGLVEAARTRLVDDGFRFVNGGNAAEFGFEESAVIIPDGTEKSVSTGQRVAASSGCRRASVTTSDRGQTVADVIVILGEDFAPAKP